jgi:hypothetical protein
VLIRADSGGGTHEFLDYCHRRRVQYSIGFGLSDEIVAALDDLDPDEWIPALDADGHVRDGAWVAEVTGIAGLSGRPPAVGKRKHWPASRVEPSLSSMGGKNSSTS